MYIHHPMIRAVPHMDATQRVIWTAKMRIELVRTKILCPGLGIIVWIDSNKQEYQVRRMRRDCDKEEVDVFRV